MNLDGSFSMAVVRRLLRILGDHDPGINRTNLAGKAGLNYGTCVRYVDLLILLRWVSISEAYKNLVCITRIGREFMRVLEKSQGSTIDEHSSDVLDFSKREFGYVKAGSVLDRHRNDDYILHPGLDHAEPISRSNRIMVVEDELDVLLTYEVLLAEQGFKVFAFSDPRLALQEFAKNPHGFDLVISDIRMNSMNGIQLYNTLKSIAPDVKIILVSALDAASELSSAIPGFRKENFIAKPVDQTKLTRTINAVLMGTPPLRTSASTKKHSYN